MKKRDDWQREMARAVKERVDVPIVLLTNSCHLLEENALEELESFDVIIARMDAATEETFRKVNRPYNHLSFDDILNGLRRFSRDFKGDFRMQLMFLKDNINEAELIADLCREIDPDLIYINTPLRPCTSRPLSKEEIEEIKPFFKGMKVKSVYG
jgi:wyosine [tRNA(Phe)-imidazoG37] synthetase (radical SAM superfamily)